MVDDIPFLHPLIPWDETRVYFCNFVYTIPIPSRKTGWSGLVRGTKTKGKMPWQST